MKVTDGVGNEACLTYDLLGRKIAMQDPDMGSWSYEYDPIGTLSAQVDAKEQRIEYGYDALKRLVRSWYPPCWARESLAAGVDGPCVYDLMELRNAVHTAGRAAGLSTVPWSSAEIWTDPEIVAGRGTPVRAVHFTELRERIGDLWTAAGMGPVPQFPDGAINSADRVIKTSDLAYPRYWLEQYERSEYARSRRARVYYGYDEFDGTQQFGRGRRTAMWDGSGRAGFRYDRAGRLAREERVIDGRLYASASSFDALDRVRQATLPDGEVLTYSYGPNGLLSQMVSSLGTTLLSEVEYNALDLPVTYLLGGSSAVSHSYYWLDQQVPTYPYGALMATRWPASGTALVERTLGYDPAGNVTSIDDQVNGEIINYGYDDLDRITLATTGEQLPVFQESFTYNQIGNLTSKNSQQISYDDPAHLHAVTAFAGLGYAYDANGSMVSRGGQQVRYDPERRPVRLDSGGSVVWRAAYDGGMGPGGSGWTGRGRCTTWGATSGTRGTGRTPARW